MTTCCWCLVSQISKGQYTDVWEVTNKSGDGNYLAKIASHPNFNYIIEQENQILKSLSHPNINKLVDTLNFGSNKAIIVEKAPGENLDRIIKNTKLPISECVEIALNVIDALEELHLSKDQRMVHRDIKPSNIMYCTESKKVTLVDFGLASPLNKDKVCLSEVLGGTLPYTPPELWIPTNDDRMATYDSSRYSSQADIYALGLTIYELITRRSAYCGNALDIVPRLFNGDIEPIERHVNISNELKEIFGQWLSASLDNRFKSVFHLKMALQKCPELKSVPLNESTSDNNQTVLIQPDDQLRYLPTKSEIANSKEAQRKLIDSKKDEIETRVKLDTHGHYLITGVPGSGKTYTLVLRALYLSNKNPEWKIGIMCFNSNLRKYIASILSSLQNEKMICGGMNYCDGSNISIFTRDAICCDILNIASDKRNKQTTLQWNEIRATALDKAEPQFDALLIDEYQDFEPSSFELAKKLCFKGTHSDGTEYERLTLIGDPAQTIFSNIHSRDNLESWGLKTKGRERWLPTSYRVNKITFEICTKLFHTIYSQSAYKKLKECASDVLAPRGSIIKAIGPKKYVAKTIITRLIENNVDTKDILIIDVQFKNDAEYFKRELTKEFPNSKFKIVPYLTSKGLEAPVVIILDASNIFSGMINQIADERANPRLYMMLTRASHTIIIHDRESNSHVHRIIDDASQALGHRCVDIDLRNSSSQSTGQRNNIVEHRAKVAKQLFIKRDNSSGSYSIHQNDLKKRVNYQTYKELLAFFVTYQSESLDLVKSKIRNLYPHIDFVFEDDEQAAA